MAATYRVVSNARQTGSPFTIVGALKQDLQVASIPVFQFAIFYSVECEINPGATMTVTGRVHSNTNLYNRPDASLTYLSGVTAVGQIVNHRHPLDPKPDGTGTVTYLSDHDSLVGSLTLPIGTNNSPDAVYAILDVPPTSESVNSPMGRQRYYNKADLIVLVSNATVTVNSGMYNNSATIIPWQQASNFVTTNVSFYNKREEKTVQATQIDVAALKTWSATNTTLRSSLGRDVRALYVADLRTQAADTESGVRLVNGQTLPPLGLTVATKNPLYVIGNYNAPSAYLGTTNTTTTVPASLVADAITVLSPNWNDGNSSSGLGSRVATSATVNAAFLAGNVPTGLYSGTKQYSGGAENFPRFLENWGSATLTYNGSMVVMFFSKIATGLWRGTGSTIGIYNPPTRKWAFDLNFMDSTKLPPGTPEVRALIRADWAAVVPNKVDYPVFCH
jgi:hypothetical protein